MENKVVTTAKIIICDDDPSKRDLLTVFLTPLGYTLLEATSGEEALEMIRREKPDLVIMDFAMPGMTGHDTVQQMRTDPEIAQTRVVAYTMLPYGHAQALAQVLGIDHVIPFAAEMEDAQRVVKAALADEPDPLALSLLSFVSRLEDAIAELKRISDKLTGSA